MFRVTDLWKETVNEEPTEGLNCLGLNATGQPFFFTRDSAWGGSGYVKITAARNTVNAKALAKPPLFWVPLKDIGLGVSL